MRAPLFLLMSIVAHGLAIGILLSHAPLRASDSLDSPNAWFEVERNPEPEAIAPSPPPPPSPHAPTEPPRPARSAAAKPRSTPSPRVPSANDQPGGIPEGAGTLPVGPAGDGLSAGPPEGAQAQASDSAAPGPPATPQPRRERRAAQLSLWLDPTEFVRLALVRPGTAVLMAVPGFRDILRGSSIRPFDDLARLRLSIAGADPEKLMIAGVHAGGEPAIRAAAQHIAAMRRQEPIWRGDSALHATSWVDGTGVDRGLALHDDAFLIGARSAMPALLGQPADGRVQAASRLRKRVFLVLAIDDAPRYLPGSAKCSLLGFRMSVATQADSQRISLHADYETPAAARAAAECLHTLGASTGAASELLGWLARAQIPPDSNTTQLSAEVTNAQIQSLLDGLAWVLRTAGRT